jgi:drug/metabolite transporter (DMT)-like permease
VRAPWNGRPSRGSCQDAAISARRLISTQEGTHLGPFGPVEWGLLLGIAAMWGSSYLWMSFALDGLPPTAIALGRIVLGAALLCCVPAARRARIAREDWPRIVLLGALWMALPLTLFPIAQESVSSSVAGMITGAQPIFAAAIAALLLRRAPVPRAIAGMLVGFAGVAAIAVSASGDGDGSSTVGALLVILAVACYGLSINLAVPLQQRYGSLAVILRALIVAVVLTLPQGIVGLAESHPTLGSVSAMVPLGLLSTGVGYVAFASLAGRAGAARGSVAIYMVPVVALALGVIVEGDPVHPAGIAGVVLVILGAWATGSASARRPAPATVAAGP